MSMEFFENYIRNAYGREGEIWLASLPDFIAELSKQHDLRDLTPVANCSYNYVALGWQRDREIVLKVGINDTDLAHEGRALQAFLEGAIIKVLGEGTGFLILERAKPGISLRSYFPIQENMAIESCCGLIESLQSVQSFRVDSYEPSLSQWLENLQKTPLNGSSISLDILESAQSEANFLASKAESPIFLHGDLHHDNILLHNGGWLAIDPKGVWGEKEYEVAAFLMNPLREIIKLYENREQELERLLLHRVRRFSERLEFSAHRIMQWGFIKATLCAVWAEEDRGNPKDFLTFARIFQKLLKKIP